MDAGWFEVRVDVPEEFGDAVANFLIESGAPGVHFEGHGPNTSLIAHFASDPPLASVRRFCASIGCPLSQSDGFQVRHVANQDWAENWKMHFHAQPVGERLYVCPSWEATAPPNRITIVIDPGMAFGTGHHATTRGCLQLLELAVRDGRVARALDVGTGSGVLAIALARLGVPEVWAIDNDPCARAVAQTNKQLNGVADRVHIAASLDDAPGTFDLVVANLFANLLEQLAPRLVVMLGQRGTLIYSGLLVADEARVFRRYACHGLSALKRHEDTEWITVELERNLKR